jgi:magnesium chelatase family protein
MHITVHALPQEELVKPNTNPKGLSDVIRTQVMHVREQQLQRQGCINAHLSARACEELCALKPTELTFLSQAMNQLKLSARGYHRLLKVSRTIADMNNSEPVLLTHIQQALSFRHMLSRPN